MLWAVEEVRVFNIPYSAKAEPPDKTTLIFYFFFLVNMNIKRHLTDAQS